MSAETTQKKSNPLVNGLKAAGVPLISIILAMIIAVFLVMWVKGTGFFDSAAVLFRDIIKGGFGNKLFFTETLTSTTPLIFTGLANAVAFKTGLFNIGVQGQFIAGMIAAIAIGLIPGLPPVIHPILCLLGGFVAGAFWGAIPGYLKAKKGINEVVNTIMMNYIAMYIHDYIVLNPLNKKGQAETPNIQQSAELWRFMGANFRVNIGLFIGLILVVVVYYLFWKTTTGYEIRAVGLSPYAAEYGGIDVKKNIILAMVISGAIAGIGGSCYVTGISHLGQAMEGNPPSYGFDGITVALIAKNHPVGVIFAALLLGVLNSSSLTLQLDGIPKEIVELVQAVIIIFIAAENIFKFVAEKRKKGAMIHE